MRVVVLRANARFEGVTLLPDTDQEQSLLIRPQKCRPWIDVNPGVLPGSLSLTTKAWTKE